MMFTLYMIFSESKQYFNDCQKSTRSQEGGVKSFAKFALYCYHMKALYNLTDKLYNMHTMNKSYETPVMREIEVEVEAAILTASSNLENPEEYKELDW